MNLKILGSSSTGNCYILKTDTDVLILECGISLKEVKKALDFDISNVKGCLQTHRHFDHSKYWKEFADAGIPVFMGPEAMISLGAFNPFVSAPFKPGKELKVGSFTIKPFPQEHGVECFGFVIDHEETGKILFATDTEYIKYRFKDLSHILVEANYDKELLQRQSANRDHVLTGHMEIQTTLEFLKETVSSGKNEDLQNVVLIHLSDKNSNEKEFAEKVLEVVKCPVYVADKGIEIEFRKEVY